MIKKLSSWSLSRTWNVLNRHLNSRGMLTPILKMITTIFKKSSTSTWKPLTICIKISRKTCWNKTANLWNFKSSKTILLISWRKLQMKTINYFKKLKTNFRWKSTNWKKKETNTNLKLELLNKKWRRKCLGSKYLKWS